MAMRHDGGEGVADSHDGDVRLRSRDVGVFGLSRILTALTIIAAAFGIIVKLMLNAEIANLRADMERFRGEIRNQYTPAADAVTRREWEAQVAERTRQITALQATDAAQSVRVEAIDSRVRELERLNDRHGWK
jgi:hypothetical protein